MPKKSENLGIDLDRPVHEDAAKTRVLARIDHHRLADRTQHALGRTGIIGRIVRALSEVILERKFNLSSVLIQPRIEPEDPVIKSHLSPQALPAPISRYPGVERRASPDVSPDSCN